jgi:hypothetical protein
VPLNTEFSLVAQCATRKSLDCKHYLRLGMYEAAPQCLIRPLALTVIAKLWLELRLARKRVATCHPYSIPGRIRHLPLFIRFVCQLIRVLHCDIDNLRYALHQIISDAL